MRGKGNGRQNAETVGLCEKYLTNRQGSPLLILRERRAFPTRDYTELCKAAEKDTLYHPRRRRKTEDVVLAIKAGGKAHRPQGERRMTTVPSSFLKNEGVTRNVPYKQPFNRGI